MKLGELLKAWREVHHIGIRDAAREIGISHGTLSRVERGLPTDGDTLIKILFWLLS